MTTEQSNFKAVCYCRYCHRREVVYFDKQPDDDTKARFTCERCLETVGAFGHEEDKYEEYDDEEDGRGRSR